MRAAFSVAQEQPVQLHESSVFSCRRAACSAAGELMPRGAAVRTLAAEAVGRPAEATPTAEQAAEGAGQVLAVLPGVAAVSPQRTLVDVCKGKRAANPAQPARGTHQPLLQHGQLQTPDCKYSQL